MGESHSLFSSAEVLREEAAWYRSMAERLESLANEAEPRARAEQAPEARPVFETNEPAPLAALPQLLQLPEHRLPVLGKEKHSSVVMTLIRDCGPITSSQIFERLRGTPHEISRGNISTILYRKRECRQILRDDINRYTITKAAIAV